MLFTSAFFIAIFLPAFLITTYLAPPARRNQIALGFSLFFYFWGAPAFLPVVLGMGALDYAVSRALSRVKRPRLLLIVGVSMQLSILIYYKYLGFFVEQSLALSHLMGFDPPWAVPQITLPLGVSFIVFEQISYLVDVYRREATPARSLPEYWTFLLLFPHSIAGPIFRWRDLEPQLRERVLDDDQIARGFARFAFGLAKKALLSNAVAHVADAMFALPREDHGIFIVWTGAAFYAMQIYLDFSAYSDMAIGLGQMIGFRFKENFKFPHLSRSITEFWERWHISLVTWFRLYIYIPLGGNRGGQFRALSNVLIVFTVSAFWHGAAWTYVFWGVFHGILVIIERVTNRKFGFVATQLLVLIGLVMFRSKDAPQAVQLIEAMLGFCGNPAIQSQSFAKLLPMRSLIAGVFSVILILKEPAVLAWIGRLSPRRAWVMTAATGMVALAAVASSSYNPFIYFRF